MALQFTTVSFSNHFQKKIDENIQNIYFFFLKIGSSLRLKIHNWDIALAELIFKKKKRQYHSHCYSDKRLLLCVGCIYNSCSKLNKSTHKITTTVPVICIEYRSVLRPRVGWQRLQILLLILSMLIIVAASCGDFNYLYTRKVGGFQNIFFTL